MKLSEYINKLKVVRYEPFKPLFGKVCMAQDKDGEYVTLNDFAHIHSEVDKLDSALDEYIEEVAETRSENEELKRVLKKVVTMLEGDKTFSGMMSVAQVITDFNNKSEGEI